jgi:hypothetical protein
VAKRISLVVTYDTETDKSTVDLDASTILFNEELCWDVEEERWVNEPALVDELTRRLNAQLAPAGRPVTPDPDIEVPASTKFIELALNIIDPDGTWDPEATLDFSDAAKVYLSEYPITHWEIEGAFSLVAQFVHDWALGEAHVEDGMSHRVGQFERRLALQPVTAASESKLERPPDFSDSAIGEMESEDWLLRTSLETVDPLSGTAIRIIFGDYERLPTMALFVGEDEDPILIDCSALEIAIEQWRETVNNSREPALSFRSNSDHELEVFAFDIDLGPMFE